MSKKFLDQNGLTYLVSKLDDYPNNTILAAVIDGIDEVKQDKVVFNTTYDSTTNKAATMADIENAFQVQEVSVLPASNISPNTIYLIPHNTIANAKDAYLYVNNTWIRLTTTGLEPSNFAKSADLASIAFNGAYGSLSGTPTKLSDFQNDVNYLDADTLNNVNISSFNNDVPYATMADIDVLAELDPTKIQEVIDAVEGLEEYDDTAVRSLISANTTDIEALNDFNSATFNAFVFCTFGIEPYVDPSTLEIVPGRYYQRSDCDTGIFMDNSKMDILLKAWFKYHYDIDDPELLKNVTVYVYAMGDHGVYVNHMVTYWRQRSNPAITAYPHLQQVGSFIDDGYGSIHRFTETEVGAILSSSENGYVAADPAGTGKGYVSGWNELKSNVDTHIAATGNPHGLTYSDIPNLTTKPLVITDNGTTTTYNILVVNN